MNAPSTTTATSVKGLFNVGEREPAQGHVQCRTAGGLLRHDQVGTRAWMSETRTVATPPSAGRNGRNGDRRLLNRFLAAAGADCDFLISPGLAADAPLVRLQGSRLARERHLAWLAGQDS